MNSLLLDLKQAFRALLRNRIFSAVSVITIAVVLAATSSVFTVTNSVLLADPPFPDSERIVQICEHNPVVEGFCIASMASAYEWERRVDGIEAAGVARGWTFQWKKPDGEAEVVAGRVVSPGMLKAFSVVPLHGRLLNDDDVGDGLNPVLVSNTFWKTRLDQDASIAGRSIELDGQPVEVAGVLPEGFEIPGLGEGDVWMALPFDPWSANNVTWRGFRAFGILAPGASIDAVAEQTRSVQRALNAEYPSEDGEWTVELRSLKDILVADVRQPILFLMASVLILLVVGALNLASLTLARLLSRRRELATRVAMGAGQFAVVRTTVSELFILLTFGLLAAAVITTWVVGMLRAYAPASIPRIDEVTVNATVLLAMFGFACIAMFVSALVPALRARKLQPQSWMRVRSNDSQRLFSGLTVLQVSLTCALLIVTVALTRVFSSYDSWDPGFDVDEVATLWVSASSEYEDGRDVIEIIQAAAAEIAAMPGVSAATASAGPLFGGRETATFRAPAASGATEARWYDVGPNYFETLNIRIVAGRSINEQDDRGAMPVAVVNEQFARRLFGSTEALGQTIEANGSSLTVVGIAEDLPSFTPGDAPTPEVYWPQRQRPRWGSNIVVVGASGAQLNNAVELVNSKAPGVSASDPIPISQRARQILQLPRFNYRLVISFSVVALVLALVGILGTTSFVVSSRYRDYGIMAAIGASNGRLARSLAGKVLGITAAGAVTGSVVYVVAGPLAAALVPGMPRIDPVAIAVTCVLLVPAALFATLHPMSTVMRVSPAAVMRLEN